ncbi:MAG: Glutamine--scyllo-inositol transaminase, partial [Verrucomicrobiaceae bacterium]|nr:Glutamine--scyllo-inositol transaminase [Verrucomicrobiaceae bacterium]
LGDAGLLVTNDDKLAEYAKILRVHGSAPKYYHHYIGGNFRIDALQAAFLSVKLKHYNGYTANRQANASFYQEHLGALPGVAQADPAHCKCVKAQSAALAESKAKVVLPISYEHNTHIWNQYTIRVLNGQRDALRDFLWSKKIGCEVYYPVTLDQQKCFANVPPHALQGCEVSHQLAAEVLSIPIYPELNETQKQEVVATIAEFLV